MLEMYQFPGYTREDGERWVVVDWDHTVTDQEDAVNCWVGRIFDKLSSSEGVPKKIKYISKIVGPVAKLKLKINPNRDPKRWEILALGYASKGTPLDELYLGLDSVPYDDTLIRRLREFKEKGYRIAITTAAPEQVVAYWAHELHREMGELFDRIYGIKLKVRGGRVEGLDTEDEYTRLVLKEGVASAKDYTLADIMGDGGTVEYTFGNSGGDVPSPERVERYLNGSRAELSPIVHYHRRHGGEFEEIVINPLQYEAYGESGVHCGYA